MMYRTILARSFMAWGFSVAAVAALAGTASACPRDSAMAGVVQRVAGQRDQVFIQRAGAEKFRPAPMEVLCEGDTLIASATGASIVYRLEGVSASATLNGPSQRELARTAGRASVTDNAMQILLDGWMPELRRSSNFGVVRGRATEPPRWATAGLSDGAATIKRGNRPLFLRWYGAAGRFQVEIVRADGEVVEKAQASKPEVRMPARNWTNGVYTVRVFEAQGKTAVLQGRFNVGDAPPANPEPYQTATGEEIRAATEALRIAKLDSDRWSLEAVQIVDTSPRQGLDREALYRSLDSVNDDD